MGTWDVGTFDNDAAADWAFGLEGQTGTGLVESAFAAVLALGDQVVDADLACEALAAAEVVARLRGNWGKRDAYTEPVDQWVEAHPSRPSPELLAQAVAAIDRVLAEPSELLELWSEGEDFDRWRSSVVELRARVAA